MNLQGKTALVTGGTRGIGAAIRAVLLEAGANVYYTGAHRRPEQNDSHQLYSNFLDSEDLESICNKLKAFNIDILVNNAGINRPASFADIPKKDFQEIQTINVEAAFRLSQAVLPHMRRQQWGRIVNIASIYGIVSRAGRAAYSVSKFGLIGMTKALAAEVAAEGILVNCVSPGVIDTDLTRQVLGDHGIEETLRRVPAGRLGLPIEIAKAVAWIGGPDNTFITGQNIVVDGGYTSI